MPSSPGPNDYQRTPERLFYRGVSLTPQDALPEGKVAYAINMRSRMEGTMEPRYGLCRMTESPLAGPIHSIFRLNDTTPFAGADPYVRFLGSGADLYGMVVGQASTSLLDSGYSGDPLTAITSAPLRSPRPYLYVADAARMRKFDSDFGVFPIGLAPPPNPPTAELTAPQVTYLNTIGVAVWTGYGGQTPFGAVPTVNRVNTIITQILYDTGTTGMASVALADMTNVGIGATLDVGASPETVIVHDVLPPVGPTSIESILYDSGNTGLCTIQPTGSFSLGQLEAPLPEEVRRRYERLNQPAPPRITVYRTIDYPVNALVLLGGVEVVRILSVALGPDGVQSFRCSTFGTFVATNAIEGLSSFRAWFNTTKAMGDPVVELALATTITPFNTTDPFVGGVQSNIFGAGDRDWSRVGTQATQPEDIIQFGFLSDTLALVQSVRIVLNVDGPTGNPVFLSNYYMYEWRANDLLPAIQAAAEAPTGLMSDAQGAAVTQGITDTFYNNQYGRTPEQLRAIGAKAAQDAAAAGGRTGDLIVAAANALAPYHELTQTDGIVTVGSGLSRQLELGNNQWLTLQCRIGDLTRVGTDTTKTLKDVDAAAFIVQVQGTTNPIVIQFSDAVLMGGFGPDVGPTSPPYVYRARYRSTVTGERGNPSPSMRAGVTPRRGRVAVAVEGSASPQCDVVDWFRFGGALARWAYVGTSPNSAGTVTFNDDMADRQIDGGEPLRTDLYQPWPTSDLPRSGFCNVAGTAVQWVSGDPFNTAWAPDSGIIINGRFTQLYQSPESISRLQVIDNCGSGTNVPFSLPSPTLLAQPLPIVFGGPINDVWFHFACGDPSDPGSVYWSHGNDPDATSDVNWLTVTSASEPLVNGFFADGIPYVWSTERLFRLIPTFGQVTTFRAEETACSRGLWNRYAFVLSPENVCCFLEKQGISGTGNGGTPLSLMDPDLRALFPQDGSVPESVRGIAPIDVCEPVRFTWVDQILYVDYLDVDGNYGTWIWEPLYQRWTPDVYTPGVASRIWEPGPNVHDNLIGGSDGYLYQVDANQITDGGVPFDWAVWTREANGNDLRALKQWGDVIVDLNAGASAGGILVTPVIQNGNVALPPTTVGIGGLVRQTYIAEVNAGVAALSRNFGLQITGTMGTEDTQRPLLYLWEPSWLPKQTPIARRVTDWEDLGYKGAKFVQGVVIRANTFNQPKTLDVQYDGGLTALTLTLLHDGEEQIAYPLAAAGWTPFIAELVRLLGADDLEWTLLDWRFVWEPAPELATQWETQYTTFDYPGFLDVHDGIVAYQSTAPVTWFLEYQDGASASYTLPSSAGLYRRVRQITKAQKGKAVRFRWTSAEPFRLFRRDMSVRVQSWGAAGGYQLQQPFGGISRIDGADI